MSAAGLDPTTTALGTWSGGRHMHFGLDLPDERLIPLLRPGGGVDTLITADAYGAGAADRLAGEAIDGLARESFCLTGAIGHDFYEGEREGAKGFPRFTDPRLRKSTEYAAYLRMATERSLERIGASAFDLLLLHNPDRRGFTDPAVWEGMAALREAGLTRMLGVAPGPANGFTLDLIECFERYGEAIDWAMIILNPFEPWPGELVLPAAAKHDVKLITRVVDYGGIFHDDVRPGHQFAERDHRCFRPDGWVEQGAAKLDRARPIAQAHGLTPLQLAAWWNLSHEQVSCVVPTLIEEPSSGKSAEKKRAELAAVSGANPLTADEIERLRAIGDNTNCMRLKGASPEAEMPAPDSWPLDPGLRELAGRWGIDPDRQLSSAH